MKRKTKAPTRRPLKAADDECPVLYPQKPQGHGVKTVASRIRCVWTDGLVTPMVIVVSHFAS